MSNAFKHFGALVGRNSYNRPRFVISLNLFLTLLLLLRIGVAVFYDTLEYSVHVCSEAYCQDIEHILCPVDTISIWSFVVENN
jgi:hypothetical protein